jgi:hypothetical protein
MLRFEQVLSNGQMVSAFLRPQGDGWLQGEAFVNNTLHAGTIRFGPGDTPGNLVSVFRPADEGPPESEQGAWEPGRVASSSVVDESSPPIIPIFQNEAFQGLAAIRADTSRILGNLATGYASTARTGIASPVNTDSGDESPYKYPTYGDIATKAATPGTDSLLVPVKHTFIHFESTCAHVQTPGTRSASAPATLMQGPFLVKQPPMEFAHSRGNCKPCAYFWGKQDGCRWGSECGFCHFCQPGELKKRRREKDRALRVTGRSGNGTPSIGSDRSLSLLSITG